MKLEAFLCLLRFFLVDERSEILEKFFGLPLRVVRIEHIETKYVGVLQYVSALEKLLCAVHKITLIKQ